MTPAGGETHASGPPPRTAAPIAVSALDTALVPELFLQPPPPHPSQPPQLLPPLPPPPSQLLPPLPPPLLLPHSFPNAVSSPPDGGRSSDVPPRAVVPGPAPPVPPPVPADTKTTDGAGPGVVTTGAIGRDVPTVVKADGDGPPAECAPVGPPAGFENRDTPFPAGRPPVPSAIPPYVTFSVPLPVIPLPSSIPRPHTAPPAVLVPSAPSISRPPGSAPVPVLSPTPSPAPLPPPPSVPPRDEWDRFLTEKLFRSLSSTLANKSRALQPGLVRERATRHLSSAIEALRAELEARGGCRTDDPRYAETAEAMSPVSPIPLRHADDDGDSPSVASGRHSSQGGSYSSELKMLAQWHFWPTDPSSAASLDAGGHDKTAAAMADALRFYEHLLDRCVELGGGVPAARLSRLPPASPSGAPSAARAVPPTGHYRPPAPAASVAGSVTDTTDDESHGDGSAEDGDAPSSPTPSHDGACHVCGEELGENEQDAADGSAPVPCGTCTLSFHLRCARPVLREVPEGDWSCAYCIADGLTKARPVARKRAKRAIRTMREVAERLRLRSGAVGLLIPTPPVLAGRTQSAGVSASAPGKKRPPPLLERSASDPGLRQLHAHQPSAHPEVARPHPEAARPHPEAGQEGAETKWRVLRRKRKPPSNYDPQLCAASDWRSDETAALGRWSTVKKKKPLFEEMPLDLKKKKPLFEEMPLDVVKPGDEKVGPLQPVEKAKCPQQQMPPKQQDAQPKQQDAQPQKPDAQPKQQDAQPQKQDAQPQQQDAQPQQQDAQQKQQKQQDAQKEDEQPQRGGAVATGVNFAVASAAGGGKHGSIVGCAVVPAPFGDSFQKRDRSDVWCVFCGDDKRISICLFCACRVCFSKHDKKRLLLCDECDSEFHTFCLSPPLTCAPKSPWYCPSCEAANGGMKRVDTTSSDLSDYSGVRSKPLHRPRASAKSPFSLQPPWNIGSLPASAYAREKSADENSPQQEHSTRSGRKVKPVTFHDDIGENQYKTPQQLRKSESVESPSETSTRSGRKVNPPSFHDECSTSKEQHAKSPRSTEQPKVKLFDKKLLDKKRPSDRKDIAETAPAGSRLKISSSQSRGSTSAKLPEPVPSKVESSEPSPAPHPPKKGIAGVPPIAPAGAPAPSGEFASLLPSMEDEPELIVPAKAPRRKPGARECMQISRRFGVNVIPKKYIDTLLDYSERGKVDHLVRMRETLDSHAEMLQGQLVTLEKLVSDYGEVQMSMDEICDFVGKI